MMCQRCQHPAIIVWLPQLGIACQRCERFWRVGPKRTVEELASLTIEHGHFYTGSTYNESGPWASHYIGYRWGRMHLIRSENGVVFLMYPQLPPNYSPLDNVYHTIKAAPLRLHMREKATQAALLRARMVS